MTASSNSSSGGGDSRPLRPIIVWFRNDLRLRDNETLWTAHADSSGCVCPIYCYGKSILNS
jgi:deoxyribodipyrimidine photolyase